MGWLNAILKALAKDVTPTGLKSPGRGGMRPPTPEAGASPVEVYRLFAEHLLAAGDEAEFATFTDAADSDRWAQILFQKGDPRTLLNFHYPYTEDPAALLARRGQSLPEGCALQEWDAESMVVFGFASAVPSEVATAVDALYRAIHGIEGAYEMTGALE
jgi:hypothetical protein